MLIGQYTHNFDDKKRVSLPAKFRKEIGKNVVVSRGLDGCLWLFTVKGWQEIAGKISGMGFSEDKRKFNQFLLAGATEVEVDSNGRILIPEYLRDFAQVNDKVIFAGVYNRIEIWNETAWQKKQKEILEEANGLAEKLSEMGAL